MFSPSYVAGSAQMSKHSLENDKVDFWKKMRYGATAAVAVGTSLYAVTTAVKKQGLITNLVDEVKTAMHTAPHLVQTAPGAAPKGMDPTPQILAPEDDETRAVLHMQMQFAMKRQDVQRVQQISRQLDLLDAQACPTFNRTAVAGMVPSFPGITEMTSATTTTPKDQASMQMTASEPPPVQHLGVPRTTRSHANTTATPSPAEMGTLSSTGVIATPPEPEVVSMTEKTPLCKKHAPCESDATPPCVPAVSAKAAPRKSTKQMEPAKRIFDQEVSPRQAALAQLQGGDVVEALDPVTCVWSPATIRSLAKNGLVEVLWDDPGHDASGKPFHPIGEVWAEQIRVKRRRPPPPPNMTPSVVRVIDEEVVVPPFDLQVGDACFAMGTTVELKWFQAKLIGVRARSPPLRIEYVATLDGQTNELLLPSPRKDYVNMDQIRRDKPEEQTGLSRERRIVKSEDKTEAPPQDASQLDSQLTQVHDSEMDEEVDKVVITPDLMCSICERPDDEENMLVCDCKKGFHIYCLKPPLEKVPDDDWLCPRCTKKK